MSDNLSASSARRYYDLTEREKQQAKQEEIKERKQADQLENIRKALEKGVEIAEKEAAQSRKETAQNRMDFQKTYKQGNRSNIIALISVLIAILSLIIPLLIPLLNLKSNPAQTPATYSTTSTDFHS